MGQRREQLCGGGGHHMALGRLGGIRIIGKASLEGGTVWAGAWA